MGLSAAQPREAIANLTCDWSQPLEAGPKLSAGFLGAVEPAVVCDMSSAGGEERRDTGGEGNNAASLFSFSPEPTLEDM